MTMEGVRSQYDYTMDALKKEQLSDGIINLDETYIMSFINIIGLIILVLSLKSWLI